MAQAPVRFPALWQTTRPQTLQLSAKGDGTNTLAAQQFVKLANASTLAVVAADATNGGYGLLLDPSHTATSEPYTAPFGEQHNVLGLQEATFVVNTCAAATRAVGTGTSSALTIGGVYGITTFTTTGYTDVQALNVSNTTAAFFKVVGFHPDDATGDTNARVLVQVVDTATSV